MREHPLLEGGGVDGDAAIPRARGDVKYSSPTIQCPRASARSSLSVRRTGWPPATVTGSPRTSVARTRSWMWAKQRCVASSSTPVREKDIGWEIGWRPGGMGGGVSLKASFALELDKIDKIDRYLIYLILSISILSLSG